MPPCQPCLALYWSDEGAEAISLAFQEMPSRFSVEVAEEDTHDGTTHNGTRLDLALQNPP
jgi:hypothetical protein